MPYDPNWPQNGLLIDGDRFREQFASLKSLIDAIQSGITSVEVDSVSTLPPGSAASVGISLNGSVLHFSFGLPEGQQGPQGNNGNDGGTGPQGPPFAGAVVDNVNTLDPGQNATVSVSFDGSNVHFTFAIPRGNDGNQGPQGIPGEVTQTDLNNALQNNLSQCSNNSNNVTTLDSPMADPDMESLRNAYNNLVNALRR
ncbi:MAG: hypothetical protein IPK32_14830 [Verrucomicrobiaceae bacterium]|nr:hypothetical protein [Verrucomicrobiaceae bacterium]